VSGIELRLAPCGARVRWTTDDHLRGQNRGQHCSYIRYSLRYIAC